MFRYGASDLYIAMNSKSSWLQNQCLVITSSVIFQHGIVSGHPYVVLIHFINHKPICCANFSYQMHVATN
jgi:hypothetical protein